MDHKSMKHLAQIQGEFRRYASSRLNWWENMSEGEQREYLQNHPESKMRLTPHHESNDVMEAARQHANKLVDMMRTSPKPSWMKPGEERHDDPNHSELQIHTQHSDEHGNKPGITSGAPMERVKKQRAYLGGGSSHNGPIHRKGDHLFDVDEFGHESSRPLTDEEAASIIRAEWGNDPYDVSAIERAKQDRLNAMNEYETSHKQKYGPNSSAWD